ncbi:hypothetical protein FIU82_05215 [Pseudoalteromonas sp. THAF3]|nr:hypothetical protein FIU82_05215 [Pseudoalteromonas sp. THAF3]
MSAFLMNTQPVIPMNVDALAVDRKNVKTYPR